MTIEAMTRKLVLCYDITREHPIKVSGAVDLLAASDQVSELSFRLKLRPHEIICLYECLQSSRSAWPSRYVKMCAGI